MSVRITVKPVPSENAAPELRVCIEIERAAQHPDRRVARAEVRDDEQLGDQVEGHDGRGDRAQQPDPPGRPGCGGLHGWADGRAVDGAHAPIVRVGCAAQRRSSRSLQATSSVAAGKALSRALGIGRPQLSQ